MSETASPAKTVMLANSEMPADTFQTKVSILERRQSRGNDMLVLELELAQTPEDTALNRIRKAKCFAYGKITTVVESMMGKGDGSMWMRVMQPTREGYSTSVAFVTRY